MGKESFSHISLPQIFVECELCGFTPPSKVNREYVVIVVAWLIRKTFPEDLEKERQEGQIRIGDELTDTWRLQR